MSNVADKSSSTRAVGSLHARERGGANFLSTIKQFPWNVLAYMLTDEDCPVCCY